MAGKKGKKQAEKGKFTTKDSTPPAHSPSPTKWHTEGCIKEIKVNDQGIFVKIDPTEKFSFGEGESSDKKLVLLEGESEDKATLVAQSVEFKFDRGEVKKCCDTSSLFSLKKDRAKLRVTMKKKKGKGIGLVYTITAITIL